VRLVEGDGIAVFGADITVEDVVVERTPRVGVIVAAEGPFTVALDTQLDEDLVAEGMARELVNRIQMLRRSTGLAVTDRVVVRWTSSDEVVNAAFDRHHDLIAGEVLASRIGRDGAVDAEPIDIDGRIVSIAVERA